MKTQRPPNILEPVRSQGHVACRICGREADVDGVPADGACRAVAAEHGFVIIETEVCYRGLCQDCLS